MSKTIKIKITVATGKYGSEDCTCVEYNSAEWSAMNGASRESALLEDMLESGIVDWNWEEQSLAECNKDG